MFLGGDGNRAVTARPWRRRVDCSMHVTPPPGKLIEVCITCCKKSDDEWMITVTGKITVKIIDWSIIRWPLTTRKLHRIPQQNVKLYSVSSCSWKFGPLCSFPSGTIHCTNCIYTASRNKDGNNNIHWTFRTLSLYSSTYRAFSL